MNEESRVSKVQKLLQKAERASTQSEAEAFFEKAQDLMTKWMIDDAMLAAAGTAEVKDEIIREHVKLKESYFRPNSDLLIGIAKANGVRTLIYTQSTWKRYGLAGVELIGWKTDIERVRLLFTSLILQMSRERRRSMPDQIREIGGREVVKWRYGFSYGYAAQISRRLSEQAQRTKEQAVKDDYTGSLLPAVRDRNAQVADFMSNVKTKTLKRRSRTESFEGFVSGVEAANRADVGNTRVGQDQKGRLER
jgi:hypothetical protein